MSDSHPRPFPQEILGILSALREECLRASASLGRVADQIEHLEPLLSGSVRPGADHRLPSVQEQHRRESAGDAPRAAQRDTLDPTAHPEFDFGRIRDGAELAAKLADFFAGLGKGGRPGR